MPVTSESTTFYSSASPVKTTVYQSGSQNIAGLDNQKYLGDYQTLTHDAKNAQFTDANKVNFTSGSKQMVQVSGSAAAMQQQDNEQGMVVTTTTLQPQKTITTMNSQAAAILASHNVRVKYVPMKQV